MEIMSKHVNKFIDNFFFNKTIDDSYFDLSFIYFAIFPESNPNTRSKRQNQCHRFVFIVHIKKFEFDILASL